MARNVIISWASQSVFIIAGFVLPRMIDRRLGQMTLGVWDFSWSMVGYLGLIQAGVSSSVDRFVAGYRASGEENRVSEVVSSIGLLLCIMGIGVLALTLLAVSLLPLLWGRRLGNGVSDAQAVLLALGASLAIEMCLGVFSGVVTGCHRWDIYNYTRAGWHVVTVIAMIILLWLGLGIRSLALASLVGLLLTNLNCVVYAFRLCPQMRVGLRCVRISMIRSAFNFGVKTLTPRLGDLLLNQTTSILVASVLGPSALALYSRPRSLTMRTGVLVSKLAFVLSPTASALYATSRREELGNLFITATRYAACISIPLTSGLAIMGGPLLLLWMGRDYANGTLVALVALGNFAMFTFMPATNILAGFNAHGRPGVIHLLSAVCSVGLVLLALGPLRLGLDGVALAVGLPLTIAYGVYISAYACGRLDIPWAKSLLLAFKVPVLCNIPSAVCLIAFRFLMPTQPILALGLGTAISGALVAITYWRYVLPDRIKVRMSSIVGIRAGAA